jgi:N4-gp56 family major capsid protein
VTIQHFKPELWAAELLVQLRKSLVFAGPGVVNHDYEGQIQQAGDTVHISSVGDVTINDYAGSVSYEDIDDAGQTLVVDQKKYFAKKFDDVDRAQSLNGGSLMAETMAQAAYRLSDVADQYVASFYTQISAGNVLTAVTQLGGASPTADALGEAAYDLLVDLGVRLDQANVPEEGRYVIVPPWYHGALRKAHAFINVEKAGDNGQALRNGVVGQAAGFDIMKSNNCAQPSAGSTYVIQAGTPMAISFANQIVKTEALRDISSFSDLVRGMHVYGGKVVYPDGLACVTVTRPAGS